MSSCQRPVDPPSLCGWQSLRSNIRLEGFVNQPAVLAHANVRAFVTHGGHNSFNEALSAGVPTHDAGGRPFGPLTPAVRAHIDEALGEAQQMLLLHRYDRVLLPAELFGPAGGRALRALGVHPDVVGYLQRRVAEALVNPVGGGGRPIGRDIGLV